MLCVQMGHVVLYHVRYRVRTGFQESSYLRLHTQVSRQAAF
jgi:hypothetical protein